MSSKKQMQPPKYDFLWFENTENFPGAAVPWKVASLLDTQL